MSGLPLASNPFAALFSSNVSTAAPVGVAPSTAIPAASGPGDANGVGSDVRKSVDSFHASPAAATATAVALNSAQDDAVQAQIRLSYYFERVLLTTLDSSSVVVGAPAQRPLHCVFLQDLFTSLQQDWIDTDVFGQVLFDRLLVPDPAGRIVRTSPLASSERPPTDAALLALTERRVIHFLWQTYRRTVSSRLGFEPSVAADVVAKCQDLVVDSAVTSLLQPDIFEGQMPAQQLADIIIDNYSGEDGELLQALLDKLVASLVLSDDNASPAADAKQSDIRRSPLYNAFYPVLHRIRSECTNLCLGQLPSEAWNGAITAGADILVFFTRHPRLGELLVDISDPVPPSTFPAGSVPSPGAGPSGAAAAPPAVPGLQYERSLLGLLLNGSSMPSRFGLGSRAQQLYSDVAQLTQVEVNSREASVWQGLLGITDRAFNLFRSLLKLSPKVRHRLLNWIGECLQANSGRVKLAAMMYDDMSGASANDCSDGFMLNLSAVLLRLCRPFIPGSSSSKAGGGFGRTSVTADATDGQAAVSCDAERLLFRIQPEYCFYQRPDDESERQRRCHHAPKGLASQTSLVPREDASATAASLLLPEPAEYAGVTELFFLTQCALHLGFHVSVEKFFKSNSDLSRLQGAYQQARQSSSLGGFGGGQDSAVKIMFENEMRKFLSMKASLTEPDYLEACLRFHAASAAYLVRLASGDGGDLTEPQADGGCSPLVRGRLSCIPEFVITNIADTLTLVKRFKEPLLQVLGADGLGRIMDLILVFMGSKDKLKNPHLRARLAIVLEELLPIDAAAGSNAGTSSSFVTAFSGQMYEQLFRSHRNISGLAETLINVFVSIEMTGEGVRFEEKFNYRRPMYRVMDYIWNIELHRNAIKVLCRTAESRMSDVDPPLFLRFINLLVNDAIYLLDEALSYMRQIREKEEAQEQQVRASTSAAVEGGPLSADAQLAAATSPQQFGNAAGAGGVASAATVQRRQQMEQMRQQQEQEAMMQHMSMLARFHNMLGADTIHTLALLTSECQSIFCHAVMVDRVAAMLNYFLLHLTGPNMKQFKVKNFEKYDFKPRLVVSDICQIYLNLGASPAFCAAVSGDGRSYSSSLFPQAARVLEKIGKPVEMIEALRALADRIQTAASRQQEEDACLGEAPDDFLDPIMGTLMKDPVILPSSRVTVDRSTIARHFLSDQTDPFNRSPLSLDMVEPNHPLKEKIEAWLASKMQATAAKRPSPSALSPEPQPPT